MPDASAPSGATTSADYSAAYYFDGHLGPPYTYEEPHWQVFFGGVADAVIELFAPETTYDAGCAIGLFVRSLLERGVDARGGDISEFAVTNAPDWLRGQLEVKDLTQPLDRRYDLVSCIEVLEHMSPADTQLAIANLCAATDTVLLSSTPDDFTEPTHINVRTAAQWAQDFARHGFFRRTDIDASFLSPWAVVFSRARMSAVETVASYENLLAPLNREVVAKRQALLEVQRSLDEARATNIADRAVSADEHRALVEQHRALAEENARLAAVAARALQDRDRLQDDLVTLRGQGTVDEQLLRLALVDELMGTRAELAQARIRADRAVDAADEAARERTAGLQRDRDAARDELHEEVLAHRQAISEVRASATWRLGAAALTPVRAVRALRRR